MVYLLLVTNKSNKKGNSNSRQVLSLNISMIIAHKIELVVDYDLILLAPTPQNSQTHSNSTSCLSVFDDFVGLVLKGLTPPPILMIILH